MSRRKRAARSLPSALDDKNLSGRLAGSRLAVFLDYDGTLAPIVREPNQALLPIKTRNVLEKLAGSCPVVILSGRDVEYLRTMVGLKKIIYAGSHGFDIAAWNGKELGNANWHKFLPVLDAAEEKLRQEMEDIAGVLVERKRFAIAVHYRKVAGSRLGSLKRRFDLVALQFPSLRKTKGKRVLELLPNVDWNKGTALISILDALYPKSKVTPVFIGDDQSDEPAFHMIKEKGVRILVGKANLSSNADYSLRNYVEVRVFLERLIQILRRTET